MDKGKGVQLEGHKLMYHVTEVADWLKGGTPAPIYIEIGPINSCNHKCSFCALDYLKSKGSMIKKDVLISNLKDMADFGVKAVMFGGEGEPLMHPALPEIISKARGFGLDISLTTNGVLLTPDKAKDILKDMAWIKFSIDAGTKERYAKVHGTREDDFPKLMANIEFAVKHKRDDGLDCRIGCQLLLINDNIDEAETLVKTLKGFGVDYLVLKPYSQHPDSINKQVFDIQKYDALLADIADKYSDDVFKVIYRRLSAQEVDAKIEYERCYGINFFALIDALGNIIPCNIFYEKEDYYYGNINERPFSRIWTGEQRKSVVSKLSEEGCESCRKACRMNFVNKYLETVKNKSKEHINFI
ncbi:radical SAM protein [Nanoarchaeota archaeon]